MNGRVRLIFIIVVIVSIMRIGWVNVSLSVLVVRGLIYGVVIMIVSMLVKNVFLVLFLFVRLVLSFCIDVLILNMFSRFRLIMKKSRVRMVIMIGN